MSIYKSKPTRRVIKEEVKPELMPKQEPFFVHGGTDLNANYNPSLDNRNTRYELDGNGDIKKIISPNPWSTERIGYVSAGTSADLPPYHYYTPKDIAEAQLKSSGKNPSEILEDLLKSPNEESYNENNNSDRDDRDEDGNMNKPVSKDKKTYLKDLYNQYIKSNDITILTEFLFKSGLIGVNAKCVNFNLQELKGKNKPADYIHNNAVRNAEDYVYSIEAYGSVGPQVFDDIVELLVKFYTLGYHHNFFMYMYDMETYKRILQLCVTKGISWDKEFEKIKNINFKELRNNGYCIHIFYSSVINKIITLDSKLRLFRSNRELDFYDFLDTQKDINTTKLNNNLEIVILNGIEYPKNLFESLIETDLDVFIQNLEVEMIIDSNKDIAESVVENKSELKLL